MPASNRPGAGTGKLRGTTVIVTTRDASLFVGEYASETGEGHVLSYADSYSRERDSLTQDEFLGRAKRIGVWGMHRGLVLPLDNVTSITPLGDFVASRPRTSSR